jgi:multidrug efflux pump subunit AcrA (membrane-fusion protein)
VVDPARRTVEAWCDIANPPEWLRANAFGSVTVITGENPNSIVVPRAAVQIDEGTRNGLVIVVDDHQLAHERQVEWGQVTSDRVQILKGLNAGETVITEGGFGLPEGTRVTFPDGPAATKSGASSQ